MIKTGIVGFGRVGSAMKKLFSDACVYDGPKGIGSREEINSCQVAFVCVPTPSLANGGCDTSAVEDVMSWIESDVVVLRSTVPVGFTDELCARYGKRVCFQPEYYGETVAHPFADLKDQGWITIGGEESAASRVAELYKKVHNSGLVINIVDAKTAELAKYMENCFLAAKVTFCNEFYDLAQGMGVNYDKLRETWLLDPRIGRSHTFVFEDDRGFGGSCLPKDTSALVSQAEELGLDASFMKAVIEKNKRLRNG